MMERERVTFSTSEQKLGDLPSSIPMCEVAGVVEELGVRRARWYERACEPTPFNSERGGQYALFERANDLGKLVDELATHIPPISFEEADLFLRSLGQD